MRKLFKHLTIHERESIELHLNRGEKQKGIAKVIGKSETCISLELKRNGIRRKGSKKREYIAKQAHIKAYQRRWRAKTQSMKINLNTEMKKFIIDEIQRTDIESSPKTIAACWNKKQKDKKNHITHTSIYAWFETGDGNKFKEFLAHKYKGYSTKKKTKGSKIKERIGLENRPKGANERTEQGHFEADLIVSKKGFRGCVLTLVDRKTRIPIIFKLKGKESIQIMRLIASVKEKYGIKTVTFDNGMEFAKHQLLNDIGIDTYFSDPYSPWQKGSIENLNRMIRRFFPKGTIFDLISDKKIRSVCCILANTPREILGFLSPNQVHFQ